MILSILFLIVVFLLIFRCLCFLFLFFPVRFLTLLFFFFFHQKTAYDLRISYWISDVCSSDLILPLWQSAGRYADAGESLVLVAGERYGTGSSRDWAAKGAALLGVRAVLAAGFERIHRSNLVNMGLLPLVLPANRHPERLALRPGDRIEIDAEAEALAPHAPIAVAIARADGRTETFTARAEVETEMEGENLRAGGLIPPTLRR